MIVVTTTEKCIVIIMRTVRVKLYDWNQYKQKILKLRTYFKQFMYKKSKKEIKGNKLKN